MSDEPDNRELAKRFELLKKDFEIMQANLNSTLNEMRAEADRRDKDNTRWQIGLWLAAIVVLGLLIRWPF